MSSRRRQAGQKQANRNSLVEICRSITRTAPRACAERMGNGRILLGRSLTRPRERCFGLCLRDVKYPGLRARKQAWAGEQGSEERSKVDRLSAHAQMTGIFGVGTCKMGKGRDGKLSERARRLQVYAPKRSRIVSSPGDIASFCI
jgi:hypothetical protein